MNVIKERAQRILTQDKQFVQDEREYLLKVMKTTPQEELIRHLETLNLNELKAVVSCGVPGFAQNIALAKLEEKKKALDMFISEGGVEAVVGTEVETEGQSEEKDAEVKTE